MQFLFSKGGLSVVESISGGRFPMTTTLDQFVNSKIISNSCDPAQAHTVPVGPDPIRNWPLARDTAIKCLERYGHALITSNGTMDTKATEWHVAREVR